MINQPNSTLGAAILKSMQSFLGSIQTSHCVHLGPAAIPQFIVSRGSENALQEGETGCSSLPQPLLRGQLRQDLKRVWVLICIPLAHKISPLYGARLLQYTRVFSICLKLLIVFMVSA